MGELLVTDHGGRDLKRAVVIRALLLSYVGYRFAWSALGHFRTQTRLKRGLRE